MTKLPKVQLIYFKLRALAEAPQMMMHYANVPYTYEMAWDFYGKPWPEAKPEVAFGQLPVLVVDGHTHIWQSGAITRYVATLTGTMPNDPLLAAQVDSVFDSTQELFPPLNPTVNVTAGEKDVLTKRADEAGRSLSEYLRQAGLGRRLGASAEQVMKTNSVLEQVLDMLQQIADQPGDNEIDMMLVLMRLQQIERVILMLAPVGGSARFAPC